MATIARLTRKDVTMSYEPPDGYWIDLPFGWVADDGAHGIVEDTRAEALAKLALAVPCDCSRCNPSRQTTTATPLTACWSCGRTEDASEPSEDRCAVCGCKQ